MIRYECDWCLREFALNAVTSVRLRNVYNEPLTLHICRDCARSRMPERAQPMLSWTADDAPRA